MRKSVITLKGKVSSVCKTLSAMVCFLVMSQFLSAQCVLSCQDNVQVAVDQGCQAEITVDMMSPGSSASCPGAKIVEVLNAQMVAIPTSPVVTSAEIGKTLTVRITHGLSGNSCWGTIFVTDKIKPVITCTDETFDCNADWKTLMTAPVATDNCSTPTVTFIETINDLACGGAYTAVITRVYTAKDAMGNTATCTKTINLKKGNLADVIFPAAKVLDCANADTDPSKTGSPTIAGKPITNFCDILVTSTDQTIPGCAGTKKILRTWLVMDFCLGTSTSAIQSIAIEDKTAPVVTCPANMTVSTSTTSCTANFTLPVVTTKDDCSGVNQVTSTYSCPTGTVTGNNISGLAIGTHTVTYKATDNCGNAATCSFTVTVQDNVPPVMVCDVWTKVSLGLDGMANVFAITFDDGSVDNCGIDKFEVSRYGTTLTFGKSVKFDCKDVGDTVKVVLRGWDVAGNHNDCVVNVVVEDKLPPVITCAPDVTVECRTDYNDYTKVGKATATDNCDVTVKTIDLVNVNQCGVGLVKRTWLATDKGGRTAACVQLIHLVNTKPFYINSANTNDPNDDVEWPKDYVTTGCGLSAAPAAAGQPVIKSDDCDVIAVNFTDTNLPSQGQGCAKILRKWIVIDWCIYKSNINPAPGYWEYSQLITINNVEPPTFSATYPDVTINADKGACASGSGTFTFAATDDCTLATALQYSVKVDFGNNLSIDKTYNAATFTEDFPMGVNRVTVSVQDGCGNVRTASFKVTVKDAKKPTPVCHHGISVDLMQVGKNGMVVMDAKVFDAGSFDNCTAVADLDIRIEPTTFTCKNIGQNLVKLFVKDKAGNEDFCTTYIDIQDNMGACKDSTTSNTTATIAGDIKTEKGDGVDEVGMKVNGNLTPVMTSVQGNYVVYKPMFNNYIVAPEKDKDAANGVTTYDIVKVQKHILNAEKLNTPYKMIAADVNHTGTISTADIVEMRKIVLGIATKFTNNTSWRFVKSDFTFPNPANPFTGAFPEQSDYSNLSGNKKTDFIAIKVGDVNNSALANANSTASERGDRSVMPITVEDMELKAGVFYTVPVKATVADMSGLQFTLKFDTDALAFEGIKKADLANISEGNFGLSAINKGLIAVSWDGTAPRGDVGIFYVAFTAKKNTTLSSVLGINSAITKAEAYTSTDEFMNVELNFKAINGAVRPADNFELYQNEPNPFAETTTIRFTLNASETATLTIMDINGRVLYSSTDQYNKGYNEVSMNKSELGVDSGILYYQVRTATHTATKKMIMMN